MSCNVCSEFNDVAQKASGNNQPVPYASKCGVRTEGKEGARRLVQHIEGRAHVAALESKSLRESFSRQSDSHPWLNIVKKHRSHEVGKLIRMAMDIYNDTMSETVSGYSWPSRNLTNERSSQLVNLFSNDWNTTVHPFVPTGMDMHYTNTDSYYEMLACIAEVLKSDALKQVQESDGFGVQIDGSSDRQQLGVKFVTARIVKNGSISTHFLGAVEPHEKGADGLLEALVQALQNPGEASRTKQSPDIGGNCMEDDTCISRQEKKLQNKRTQLSAPIFEKMLSVTTDGESANTGKLTGLWKQLGDGLQRFILCLWCVCHRSDLAFHDVISAVVELKHWYSQTKDAVKYFRSSAVRTKCVKKHCDSLGIKFKTFVNPPEVRFAEHVRDMCSSLLGNLPACMEAWKECSVNEKETSAIRKQADGYLQLWNIKEQQFRLTTLMSDLLHHMACLQKEFQKCDLMLFEVPAIQDQYIQRISIMTDKPYPGGCEEMNNTFPDIEATRSHESESCEEPPVKLQKRRVVNSYVSTKRSYAAIRQEAVLTLKNVLEQRMAIDQNHEIKNLQQIFESQNAEDMATRAGRFVEKMKIGNIMELTDQCIAIYVKDPLLCNADMSSSERFNRVAKTVSGTSALNVIVTMVLSAVPHSMTVERTVSHYNIIRSDKRLSLSLQSTNDRLIIALNGLGTAFFDPRPAVAIFLQKKTRRYREPELQLYCERAFIKKFFRDKNTF